MKIPVAVSARHAHLSAATLRKLFGDHCESHVRNWMSQTGQFSAEETVSLVGPRGQLDHVRLMGPPRQNDQIELSRSDAEVPDLTLIARRANGAYPRDRIEKIIDGRHIIGAHGSRTMPVWGDDLSQLELGNPDAERGARLIILRLADYVWLLQKPNAEGTRN